MEGSGVSAPKDQEFLLKAMQQQFERIQLVLGNMNDTLEKQQNEINALREGAAQNNPRARRQPTPQYVEESEEEFDDQATLVNEGRNYEEVGGTKLILIGILGVSK